MPAQASAERLISYREALAAALASNPTLSRAGVEEAQAKAGVMSARGIFDPQLAANGSWTTSQRTEFQFLDVIRNNVDTTSIDTSLSGTFATGTGYELSGAYTQQHAVTESDTILLANERRDWRPSARASLTQQLLKGAWLNWNLQNVSAQQHTHDVAALSLERTKQQTVADTAAAYWNWTYQVRLVEIGESSVEVADEALRVGRLKVQAGELAPVEQTRLEAALVQAQVNALDARQAARDAANTLLLLMGDAPGTEVVPSTVPGDVPELGLDPEAVVAAALADNIDLVIAREQLERAEVERSYAKHATLPGLAATVSAGTGSSKTRRFNVDTDGDGLPDGNTTTPGDNADLSIGGTFSFPLGNRAARGEARVKKLGVQTAQLQVEELERSVRSQVERQVLVLQTAKERVELADANLRLAEQTLSAEEALADAGRSIQKDVLEARAEVDRTAAEAAKARTDYQLAQVELMRLQGKLEAPPAP